ncbi:MAG: hypothetical protein ABW166_12945 [Sedimenticola sp.]
MTKKINILLFYLSLAIALVILLVINVPQARSFVSDDDINTLLMIFSIVFFPSLLSFLISMAYKYFFRFDPVFRHAPKKFVAMGFLIWKELHAYAESQSHEPLKGDGNE